jgi:hypothetical protein
VQRELPRIITLVTGLFLAIQYFIPHKSSVVFYETSLDWLIIIGIFSIILGVASLANLHVRRLRRREKGWFYSAVLMIGLAFMVLTGLIQGTERGGWFIRGYDAVLNPITATMFALLAFFIASAAYRAFRARTVIATILLVSAIIVMLGRVPVGEAIPVVGPKLASLTDWLLNVPNMAAKRAIAIGIGLGGSATALKVILGIEAPHLR